MATKGINKNTERLSTSLQLNRASDDAAGLSITEKMRGQIAGLNKASQNAQDSISLIQTAEGAMNEVHHMLLRGRELAIQSANDTNIDEDRLKLQQEFNQISAEINRIGTDTEFNTMKLFDSSIMDLTFQLGANSSQNIGLFFMELSTDNLGISEVSLESQQNSDVAIKMLDEATLLISDQRTALGAVQNRLQHTILNNGQTGSNLSSAESIIRDANMAFEVMGLTKNEILRDTMYSALSHANMKNDTVLNLLN